MKAIRSAMCCCAALSLLVTGCGKTEHQAGETLDTRIGELSFTHDFANGYPVDATQELLFDEMDSNGLARPTSGRSLSLGSRSGNMPTNNSVRRTGSSSPWRVTKTCAKD